MGRSKSKKPALYFLSPNEIPFKGLVADASCLPDPHSKRRDGYFHGRTEWQVFDLESEQMIQGSRVYQRSTINISEYCAIVDALRILYEREDETTPVLSDSQLALKWAMEGYVATKLPRNEHTADALFDLREAHEWMLRIKPKNPLMWWNKEVLGDNPADFGRK